MFRDVDMNAVKIGNSYIRMSTVVNIHDIFSYLVGNAFKCILVGSYVYQTSQLWGDYHWCIMYGASYHLSRSC